MQEERNIWVLGGDMRQGKLAQLLAEDGHRVHVYALEAGTIPGRGVTAEDCLAGVEQADCVILPLPVRGKGGHLSCPLSKMPPSLAEVLDALSPEQRIFGGRIDGETEEMAAERGLTIRDYFAREELTIANAVPTAEGAVQIALERLPITLHGAQVLVTGFGRVGQATAQRMAALGARVTVAARRYEALALAQAAGYGTEHIGHLAGRLRGYDLIVNTVPARILGETELADLKPECLVLDLASKPGGVDPAASARLGRNVICAPSLPGKVAPVTAGAAIKTTIDHMLRELGV